MLAFFYFLFADMLRMSVAAEGWTEANID